MIATWRASEAVLASILSGVSKLTRFSRTFVAFVAALLIAGPPASAADIADLGTTPAVSEWPEVNQVLEIPQQCSQQAVAVWCDRSEPDSSSNSAAGSSGQDQNSSSTQTADSGGNYGTADDYQNQATNMDPVMGPAYVPVPVFVPAYPVYVSRPMPNPPPRPVFGGSPWGHHSGGGGHHFGRH